MYDTATAATNELPLQYGSSEGMLSSLSLSAFVIQRPEPDVSFSWSDFPMMKEDNKRYAASSSGCSMSNHSHSSSTLSDFSSTSSSMNLLDESTTSSTRTRELSSRRNVRFSPHLAVRTYNLVLGDHPLGQNGLAIENGWEYDSQRRRN
mmetsp:Transcript_30921/g.34604  ORF Transcript_30921/g.34604 Transcript_30921/m.34604 type:complete len:149 (+) Transcript_30921:74-520(+)